MSPKALPFLTKLKYPSHFYPLFTAVLTSSSSYPPNVLPQTFKTSGKVNPGCSFLSWVALSLFQSKCLELSRIWHSSFYQLPRSTQEKGRPAGIGERRELQTLSNEGKLISTDNRMVATRGEGGWGKDEEGKTNIWWQRETRLGAVSTH